ncbi:hypothetical protein GGE66_000244 [Rhizobium leguminosarum]|uniref:Uncharacterized protein n=1 Tax=Rhizobium leguminosarum TaxID=384 RepID=A0A7W9ZN16_RHILE|nr:hypothetical protein [Rhizobium leguminosarum]
MAPADLPPCPRSCACAGGRVGGERAARVLQRELECDPRPHLSFVIRNHGKTSNCLCSDERPPSRVRRTCLGRLSTRRVSSGDNEGRIGFAFDDIINRFEILPHGDAPLTQRRRDRSGHRLQTARASSEFPHAGAAGEQLARRLALEGRLAHPSPAVVLDQAMVRERSPGPTVRGAFSPPSRGGGQSAWIRISGEFFSGSVGAARHS